MTRFSTASVAPGRLLTARRTTVSGATAPSRRVPVKDRTPPLFGRSMGGASGNAPESGTAELTKLEIRPDLDNDEIAGWRRRGHRDADARRGARFKPVVGRYSTTAT